MNYSRYLDELYRKCREECINTMDVVGQGVIKAAPDIAITSIGVITTDKEVEAAEKENMERSLGILKTLKEFGVKNEDIQTQSYNVDIVYDHVEGRQIFKEYRITNIYRVTIREIHRVGIIMDSVIKSGANFLGNIDFAISYPSKYYRKALALALQDAEEKAAIMADRMGAQLEDVPLKITEETREVITLGRGYSAKTLSDEVQVEPGQLQVSASMRVLFMYYKN